MTNKNAVAIRVMLLALSLPAGYFLHKNTMNLVELPTIAVMAFVVISTFALLWMHYEIEQEKNAGTQKGPAGFLWGASFFFSLGACATPIIALAATALGAIDSHGTSTNYIGDLLFKALGELSDINVATKIVGAAMILAIGPQILTYVISGAFGVAKKPLYLPAIIDSGSLFLAKPFVTSSGVFFGLYVCGVLGIWHTFNPERYDGMLFISVIFFCCSLFLYLLKHLAWTLATGDKQLVAGVAQLHGFATRNRTDKGEPEYPMSLYGSVATTVVT
jgi:hypothetical protein